MADGQVQIPNAFVHLFEPNGLMINGSRDTRIVNGEPKEVFIAIVAKSPSPLSEETPRPMTTAKNILLRNSLLAVIGDIVTLARPLLMPDEECQKANRVVLSMEDQWTETPPVAA